MIPPTYLVVAESPPESVCIRANLGAARCHAGRQALPGAVGFGARVDFCRRPVHNPLMPQRRTCPPATYLTRMDYARAKGWVVRTPQQADGRQPGKFFADEKHGGSRRAKAAAAAWRDVTFKNLIGAAPNGRYVHRRPSAKGKGRRVGVLLVTASVQYQGVTGRVSVYRKVYWVARWCAAPLTVRSKYFSIKRYGYHEARRLAIVYRAKMEKRVLGLSGE